MILQGDCRDILKTLPDKSVHCVVTSPPYWGLRDYGVTGQIGLEKTPDEYVATMVQVFREVKRVLRDDGTLWLNLGDSYNANFRWGGDTDMHEKWASNRGQKQSAGASTVTAELRPKNLTGIPWRVAFALQADGWYLRSDIIWHKPNPMPESVTDRPTKSHEYVFLMSKSARYFYDAEAVREDAKPWNNGKMSAPKCGDNRPIEGTSNQNKKQYDVIKGANRRSVWTIATQPSSEPHFAMFPEALVVPCIKAGTSEHGVCPECGAQWERVVDTTKRFESGSGKSGNPIVGKNGPGLQGGGTTGDIRKGPCIESKTIGFHPTCKCGREDRVQATVLDPFSGMATVGVVCNKLGRKYIGIELNPKYAGRSEDRKDKAANLFSDVV